jgi:hypothetical protein
MKDMVGINQRTINGLFGLFLPSYSKPRCNVSDWGIAGDYALPLRGVGTLGRVPSFVSPESSAFAVDDGRAMVRLQGVAIQRTEGWSLLNRATMLVVDGPDDEGFLVSRLDPAAGDRAPREWDAAVTAHISAWIILDSGDVIFAGEID